MTYDVQLTKDTYNLLRQRSHEIGRKPDELADKVLREHLSPAHPYVEVVATRSGSKARVKGTRVAVSTIVGYVQLGESPESIAQNVLPHIALAQVHAALSYYYDHQDAVDAELARNTEAASQERLYTRLGETDFRRLTGQAGRL